MSVMVYLDLHANRKDIERLKSVFKGLLSDTRKYDGCQSVDVFQSQHNPNNLVLVEHWGSRKHYEAYLAWRTETGALDSIVSMLSQPPDIHYFDCVDA